MKSYLKRIKNRIFYFVVEKNQYILREYQIYRWNNEKIHKKYRFVSWGILLFLNLKYRIFRVNSKINNNNNNKVENLEMQESKELLRERPESLARRLLQYDIISFDIFDTLIFRLFEKPEDVFYLLGMDNGIANFHLLRMKSEKEARDSSKGPSRETTIYDIYKVLEKKTDIKPEKGVEAEFELEKKICIGNPYMKRVFDILKLNNKTIIATSNMYLPKNLMEELLKSCGYEGFEDIYVSCDYGCNKTSKDLYRVVKNTIGKNKKIIHIGDNFRIDIEASRAFGWNAIHYPKVMDVSKKYRNNKTESLVGSIYKGIVSAYMHNGLTNRDINVYYEYGFVYGGLLACGFCQWLNEYADKNGFDKILFFARDGYILQEIYNTYYRKYNNDYILWSRSASQVLVMDRYLDEYIEKNILERLNSKQEVTIGELLESCDLSVLRKFITEYNLKENQLLDKFTYECLVNMMYDKREKIVEYFKDSIQASREYLAPILNGTKKACAVDIGWKGTGIAYLKHLVEDIFNLDVEIDGAMVGALNSDFSKEMILRGNLDSYLFSKVSGNDNLENYNKNMSIAFIELLFSAPHPSLNKFSKSEDGSMEFIFSNPEVHNYEIINEVHNGIRDFAKIYNSYFKDYSENLKISPKDAFEPIEKLLRNSKRLKEVFGQFEINVLVQSFKKGDVKTLKDIE